MTGALSTACIVNRIVASHLDLDPAALGPGLPFAKLGATDIDMIHVVMAVEDAFDFEATDEDAEAVKTVVDLVRLAERALGETAVAA